MLLEENTYYRGVQNLPNVAIVDVGHMELVNSSSNATEKEKIRGRIGTFKENLKARDRLIFYYYRAFETEEKKDDQKVQIKKDAEFGIVVCDRTGSERGTFSRIKKWFTDDNVKKKLETTMSTILAYQGSGEQSSEDYKIHKLELISSRKEFYKEYREKLQTESLKLSPAFEGLDDEQKRAMETSLQQVFLTVFNAEIVRFFPGELDEIGFVQTALALVVATSERAMDATKLFGKGSQEQGQGTDSREKEGSLTPKPYMEEIVKGMIDRMARKLREAALGAPSVYESKKPQWWSSAKNARILYELFLSGTDKIVSNLKEDIQLQTLMLSQLVRYVIASRSVVFTMFSNREFREGDRLNLFMPHTSDVREMARSVAPLWRLRASVVNPSQTLTTSSIDNSLFTEEDVEVALAFMKTTIPTNPVVEEKDCVIAAFELDMRTLPFQAYYPESEQGAEYKEQILKKIYNTPRRVTSFELSVVMPLLVRINRLRSHVLYSDAIDEDGEYEYDKLMKNSNNASHTDEWLAVSRNPIYKPITWVHKKTLSALVITEQSVTKKYTQDISEIATREVVKWIRPGMVSDEQFGKYVDTLKVKILGKRWKFDDTSIKPIFRQAIAVVDAMKVTLQGTEMIRGSKDLLKEALIGKYRKLHKEIGTENSEASEPEWATLDQQSSDALLSLEKKWTTFSTGKKFNDNGVWKLNREGLTNIHQFIQSYNRSKIRDQFLIQDYVYKRCVEIFEVFINKFLDVGNFQDPESESRTRRMQDMKIQLIEEFGHFAVNISRNESGNDYSLKIWKDIGENMKKKDMGTLRSKMKEVVDNLQGDQTLLPLKRDERDFKDFEDRASGNSIELEFNSLEMVDMFFKIAIGAYLSSRYLPIIIEIDLTVFTERFKEYQPEKKQDREKTIRNLAILQEALFQANFQSSEY